MNWLWVQQIRLDYVVLGAILRINYEEKHSAPKGSMVGQYVTKLHVI